MNLRPSREYASAVKSTRRVASDSGEQPPTPTGFAQIVSDDFPVLDARNTQGCPRSNCRRYIIKPSKPNVTSRNVEP
jgi:hypothetical protein